MEKLKVGLAQMISNESVDQNLEQILSFIGKMPKDLSLFCLPENSLYNKISHSSPGLKLTDQAIQQLQDVADQKNMAIHLGAIPLLKQGNVYNSTVLLTPGKSPQSVYDKIHLFDISIGDLVIRESDQFTAGNSPQIIELYGWKMGFSICYDVRFSELYKFYHDNDVDLIFVPSAFTRHTGRAHWNTLMRARAIENQCYIMASAQAGTAKLGDKVRHSYGHSCVFDPWGRALIEMDGESINLEVVELDKSMIQKTRENMPISDHRRL